MNFVKVEPGKAPFTIDTTNDLASLQHEVEGYIEAVYPFDDPVVLIVNEEGKINGMELNRALTDEKDEIYDIIAGPFLIVGYDEETCDFCSLTDEMALKYMDIFALPETFIRVNGKIKAIKIGDEVNEL